MYCIMADSVWVDLPIRLQHLHYFHSTNLIKDMNSEGVN